MNKKLILAALLAVVCGCEQQNNNSDQPKKHDKCNSGKCNSTSQVIEKKEEAVAPQKVDVAVAAPAEKVEQKVEAKVEAAAPAVEAKKAE